MAKTSLKNADFTPGSGSISNDAISSTAQIDADKLEHLYKHGTTFDLAKTATPVAREEIIHVAEGVGVLRGFACLLFDTGTSTNIDFDLKVNASSVLDSVVNITHSDGDGTTQDGTITSTALADGDIVSISLAVTSSTGAQGPFAWVTIEELAQ